MAQYLRKTNKVREFFQLLFGHPMGAVGVAIITLFITINFSVAAGCCRIVVVVFFLAIGR